MPFAKGQSGNPAGRAKTAHALSVLARKHCRKAIQLCVRVVQDETEKSQTRLVAAGMLLDRGLGKPAQGVTAQTLSDEELVAELMLRRKIRDADERRNQLSTGEGPQQ